MDRLHVERVSEDEGDPFLGAEVGKPVPGEDALDGHHDILTVRSDDAQEMLWGGEAIAIDAHLALRVEDADVHPPGVQIDATVVSVLGGVEPHPVSSFPRCRGCGLFGRNHLTLTGGKGGAWMRIIGIQPTRFARGLPSLTGPQKSRRPATSMRGR